MRQHHVSPKHIQFKLLGQKRLSVHQMIEQINQLNHENGQGCSGSPPRMMALFEALCDEEMSSHWKIPSVTEITQIREKMLRDLQGSVFGSNSFYVWAISERPSMFVAFNLLSGKYEKAIPKDIFCVLRGNAPDSKERCFAFAVSVRSITNETNKRS